MTSAAPRKILFYNHTGGVSGAEVVLLSVLRGLDRTQFAPVLISPEGELVAAAAALDVPHRPLRVISARFSTNVLATAGYLREMLTAIGEFRKVLQQEKPDLLHANSIRAGLVATIAARGLGFPVLWHLHDILPSHPFSAAIRRMAQRSKATRLLAVSRATAEGFRFSGGRQVVHKHVYVVYNSIDTDRFQPNPEARARVRAELGLQESDVAIGAVAQITPRKRQVELVQIFAAIRSAIPQAKLFIVGEAQFHVRNQQYALRLRNVVEGLRAEEQIVLSGRRRDVPDFLNAMDIVALNSDGEPLGLSLMEGLATGKPALSIAVEGIPEVVTDGVDGLLSPVTDSGLFASHLQTLVNDSELRVRMGLAGRAAMQRRFSPDEQMQQMQALYNELIAEHTGTQR